MTFVRIIITASGHRELSDAQPQYFGNCGQSHSGEPHFCCQHLSTPTTPLSIGNCDQNAPNTAMQHICIYSTGAATLPPSTLNKWVCKYEYGVSFVIVSSKVKEVKVRKWKWKFRVSESEKWRMCCTHTHNWGELLSLSLSLSLSLCSKERERFSQ